MKGQKLHTISEKYSSKTIEIKRGIDQRQEIQDYFMKTYQTYEELFKIIKDQTAYYLKPQPLRHPLIFYFGHTATVYVNKLYDANIINQRVNHKFQSMFAVGVDQMDWDDLNEVNYDWPSVSQVRKYRETVKTIVINSIRKCHPKINWNQSLWVILMGIQHERIHLETSAVIIRRLHINFIYPSIQFIDCPARQTSIQNIPKNQMVRVERLHQQWPRQRQNTTTYGWDNQFGYHEINVDQFEASEMLVSNGEYLQFVKSNGYMNYNYWTQEGQSWLKSCKQTHPLFWEVIDINQDQYKLRTLNTIINMPWDWPVQVNNLQAHAFCNWKSQKLNKKIRLPTEDQYYAIRQSLKTDQPNWQYQTVGNINLQFWMSPNPVNMFKIGNFYDIVGNVWQHTITPIYPFQGFEIHPVYEDFSTPTFDQRHNLIKGGSFISTGNQAIAHSRYAFRRHFYQFAGFRYVQSSNSTEVSSIVDQSDEKVQTSLKIHYKDNDSYLSKAILLIKGLIKNIQLDYLRALTIGCSVGKATYQFGNYFNQSVGVDYTARFFQMAVRLYQKGFVTYKNISINLNELGFKPNHVTLYQFNPQNPDPKKLKTFDLIFVDGMNLRQGRLMKVLAVSQILMKQRCLVLIISHSKNEFKEEQLLWKRNKEQIFSQDIFEDIKLNGYVTVE